MGKLSDSGSNFKIDKKKANRIIKWLIDVEEENNRTGKDSDTTMVQRIGKQIREDIRCL